MTDEKIVPLRVGPSINDIPGMLRQMADGIENGDVRTNGTVYLIIPDPPEEEWPDFFVYGEHPGDAAIVGHMTITVHMLAAHHLERHP